MPQPCVVCNHPELATINKRLLEGDPASDIAKEYGIIHVSVWRHKKNHLFAMSDEAISEAVLLNEKVTEEEGTGTVLEDVDAAEGITGEVLHKDEAVDPNDPAEAEKMIAEAQQSARVAVSKVSKQLDYTSLVRRQFVDLETYKRKLAKKGDLRGAAQVADNLLKNARQYIEPLLSDKNEDGKQFNPEAVRDLVVAWAKSHTSSPGAMEEIAGRLDKAAGGEDAS